MFGLFFVLAVIAGSIGFAGDGLLGSGLRDSVDILLHGLSQQVSQVRALTTRINQLTAGTSSLDAGDLSMIDEISCFVGKAQSAIEDNGAQLFSIRSIAVLCVSLVPMTVMIVGLVAALCNLRHLSCCVATQIAWLMLVSCCVPASNIANTLDGSTKLNGTNLLSSGGVAVVRSARLARSCIRRCVHRDGFGAPNTQRRRRQPWLPSFSWGNVSCCSNFGSGVLLT